MSLQDISLNVLAQYCIEKRILPIPSVCPHILLAKLRSQIIEFLTEDVIIKSFLGKRYLQIYHCSMCLNVGDVDTENSCCQFLKFYNRMTGKKILMKYFEIVDVGDLAGTYACVLSRK